MFEKLTKMFLKDRETRRRNNAFYIRNGYMRSWSAENQTRNDNGIRRYSTDLRWRQYNAGEITRKQAVDFAIKRMNREIDKSISDGLARIEAVSNAPDLVFIRVNVEYRRSSVWGYNPATTADTNNATTHGYASGCGYDKTSASVADAFNRDNSILKVLYTLKENGLKAGKTSASDTACTGHDNRYIIGYGAGYSVLPYFEGGVGVDCFWSILKKAGFETHSHYGKHESFFRVDRI